MCACKFFLERERNKERASAAVLAWLQCVGGSVRLWVFAARMAAQSSTEDVLMESAGTPTELPSPTPLAAEAWPATAAAAAGMAGGAGIAGRGCRHPASMQQPQGSIGS